MLRWSLPPDVRAGAVSPIDLYLANLADGSGMIQPSLSWVLHEHATLSMGTKLPYGGTGDEYTLMGPQPGFWIGATLGAGKF